MGFWILVITAAVGIVLVLAYALLSPARDTARAAAEFDMAVYRDQLKELERDKARGVLSEAEAARAEVEISRRLLEADKAAQATSAPRGAPSAASIAGIVAMALVIVGGGTWLYADLGAPGYADLPLQERKSIAAQARENRPTQAMVEAELPEWTGPDERADADYVELVEKLRRAVEMRPDDVEGLGLLARHEAQLGNFRAAYRAQERLIANLPNPDATDYAELAEMMILAANGFVSPEAESALEKSLGLDPNNGIAQYYSGLMFAQTRRPDLAFRLWRKLYETSRPDAPWMAPIAAQLPELAQVAGVNYTMPDRGVAALTGPSLDELARADDMSAEARDEMIAIRVEQLMARLAQQGGSAQEWAELIRGLGMIGDTARAGAIWGEAQARFAGRPEELSVIAEAARAAGVADTAAAPALPGPSAEDMEAASEMSAADRNEMIAGMINQLADRIATEGGAPEEWARLIQVLGVQGDTERAAATWEEARATFADDAEALATIRAAAEAAGVAAGEAQ